MEGNQMTRKDYILLANGFRDALSQYADRPQTEAIEHAAFQVSTYLKEDNPRFDQQHFLAVVRGERTLNSHPKRAA
jgi:hypothetical protein